MEDAADVTLTELYEAEVGLTLQRTLHGVAVITKLYFAIFTYALK